MFDKDLVISILIQIDGALQRIDVRAGRFRSSDQFTNSPRAGPAHPFDSEGHDVWWAGGNGAKSPTSIGPKCGLLGMD